METTNQVLRWPLVFSSPIAHKNVFNCFPWLDLEESLKTIHVIHYHILSPFPRWAHVITSLRVRTSSLPLNRPTTSLQKIFITLLIFKRKLVLHTCNCSFIKVHLLLCRASLKLPFSFNCYSVVPPRNKCIRSASFDNNKFLNFCRHQPPSLIKRMLWNDYHNTIMSHNNNAEKEPLILLVLLRTINISREISASPRFNVLTPIFWCITHSSA